MSAAVPTIKLTISVIADFYDDLLHAAGPRKIGAFIEPIVASKTYLKVGYEAMAADTQREKEAREWLHISGEPLKNQPVANNMEYRQK